MTFLYLTLKRSYICHYVARRFKSSSTKHNLQSLLINMPKQVNHTAALKKHRLKLKEKSQRYSPGLVSLQVLGSGANGAPRSLYVFSDQARYLFNCGEGSQRLAHEHKMKLAKLEHIFFTYSSWENIGGLPGVSLTIQDVGVPEITIHGPPGIADIFSATRRFVVLKDLSVKTASYEENSFFEDGVMRIDYVPLTVKSEHMSRRTSVSLDRTRNSPELSSSVVDDRGESSCSDNGTTTDDETDYYAHEREGTNDLLQTVAKPKKNKKKKNKRSASENTTETIGTKRRCMEPVGHVAMSYICTLHPRAGTLNLEACVERGVPPGPLLGRLKSGEDVTLPDGRIVKSSDVTAPDDPGPIFIVVECPDERFLDSLEKEVRFSRHQSNCSCPDDMAFLVVHFTPPHIVKNPRYQNWMEKFSPSTHHLMLNEDNDCMGSVAVHRIQYKLHLIDPKIFPLLPDFGIPVVESSSSSETCEAWKPVASNGTNMDCSKTNDHSSSHLSSFTSSKSSNPICHGRTLSRIQLRPQKHMDSSSELTINLDEYKEEVFQIEGMKEALDELHVRLENYPAAGAGNTDKTQEQAYPSIVFLGTGSCIPNKTRNTSGILLNISENLNMLLDCGEGTYGQLVRFHGKDNIGKIMSSLKAIFISHLHADHHIGLIGILKARRKYTSVSNSPVFLIAPKQIMTWLKYYNDHFEQILQQVELIPNSDLVYNNRTLSDGVMKRVCESLDMSSILTAGVKHCPNSFGVALKHKSDWKITYSGDTMPCDSLVELGKDSTLLIHEATMEDDLKPEARRKMHSTTSEAISMGKTMNAQFTLLTHFSQRYATLPRFNDNIKEGVGIAFDNMKVRLCDLPKLPMMYPALQLMFSSHQDELEQKAYRRQLKELRMVRSRSPSPKR